MRHRELVAHVRCRTNMGDISEDPKVELRRPLRCRGVTREWDCLVRRRYGGQRLRTNVDDNDDADDAELASAHICPHLAGLPQNQLVQNAPTYMRHVPDHSCDDEPRLYVGSAGSPSDAHRGSDLKWSLIWTL